MDDLERQLQSLADHRAGQVPETSAGPITDGRASDLADDPDSTGEPGGSAGESGSRSGAWVLGIAAALVFGIVGLVLIRNLTDSDNNGGQLAAGSGGAEGPVLSCIADFDEIQSLLRSGLPGYDHQPVADVSELIDMSDAVVVGRLTSIRRQLPASDDSVTDERANSPDQRTIVSVVVEEVLYASGDGDLNIADFSFSSFWAGREDDPIETARAVDDVEFLAFLSEDGDSGEFVVSIQGFVIGCGESAAPAEPVILDLSPDLRGLSLNEAAEAVRTSVVAEACLSAPSSFRSPESTFLMGEFSTLAETIAWDERRNLPEVDTRGVSQLRQLDQSQVLVCVIESPPLPTPGPPGQPERDISISTVVIAGTESVITMVGTELHEYPLPSDLPAELRSLPETPGATNELDGGRGDQGEPDLILSPSGPPHLVIDRPTLADIQTEVVLREANTVEMVQEAGRVVISTTPAESPSAPATRADVLARSKIDREGPSLPGTDLETLDSHLVSSQTWSVLRSDPAASVDDMEVAEFEVVGLRIKRWLGGSLSTSLRPVIEAGGQAVAFGGPTRPGISPVWVVENGNKYWINRTALSVTDISIDRPHGIVYDEVAQASYVVVDVGPSGDDVEYTLDYESRTLDGTIRNAKFDSGQ